MTKLFTQGEICALLRISYQTLCRWMNAHAFPLPINGRGRGKKLLFTEQSVLEWIHRHNAPVDTTPPIVSPAKQQKREAKAFNQRQEAARQTLERHAAGRKGQFNTQSQERRSS